MRGVSLALVALVAAATLVGAGPGQPLPARLKLVDDSRTLRLPGGRVVPRPLTTDLWYPPSGSGPWPLVVFAHGYALTPQTYARLLRAWARAGYLVAAPVFPRENANAPGGPSRGDLVNEPRDVSFVIGRLLAASRDPASPLHGLVDPTRIAVAGHSDGAMVAFATAYDRPWRDPRVRAAIVLSGAQLGGTVDPAGPPLLAATGTDDAVNTPDNTIALFRAVDRPRFLLLLRHQTHLAPFTSAGLALATAEKVTIAFLDRYLGTGSLRALEQAADGSGVGSLASEP